MSQGFYALCCKMYLVSLQVTAINVKDACVPPEDSVGETIVFGVWLPIVYRVQGHKLRDVLGK